MRCRKWRKVRIRKSLDGYLLGVGGTEEHRSKEKWIPHVTQDLAACTNVGGSRGLKPGVGNTQCISSPPCKPAAPVLSPGPVLRFL